MGEANDNAYSLRGGRIGPRQPGADGCGRTCGKTRSKTVDLFRERAFRDFTIGHQAHTLTDAEADEILADATAKVKVLRHELSSAKVLLDREASTAIINHAIALGADHIVIGTGDKRGLERMILGSVAKDIATRAACTVTIVR
jgi:nucleotide-binding universal stress UspA family protein